MTNMYFQVASFFYMLMILVMFFSKKRIKNDEMRIFSILSIINIIGILLDIIIVFLSYVSPGILPLYILNKFYLLYILYWISLFCIYVGNISLKNEKYQRNLKKCIMYLNIISTILILIIPIYLFNKNNIMYTYGPSVTVTYIVVALIVFLILIITLKNIKIIISKKYSPVIILVFCCFIGLIVRQINPAILLTTSIITFINVLMYHTIENPDMKLIVQLNEARDQAEKANNAKSEFLSSMSHEIRTPLNAIVGFSQALKEEDIPESSKSEVDDIIMASQNLLEIVNGILDISKIEANKIEIINVDYNFKKVFDELTVLTKARLGEKPIDFRISYDNSIPNTLHGDYSRIKQVVLNILTNAVKYTDEGYIEFRVSSIKKDNVCRLIISVEDSGIGIKQENISKLFSKFERFDEERNITIEGTGLGLAITKKLVDLMNGKIVVQSIYGQGSKFTVAIDQLIAKDQVEVLELEEENLNLDLSSKKILIVDDNRVNLKVATRLLKNYQVQTDEAISGDECITKIRSGKTYDLILMDDMMPKMSGVETLKYLKELEDFNIPTVALTANAISGMREKYLSEGFDDYLAKPIDKKELEKVLQNFLSK